MLSAVVSVIDSSDSAEVEKILVTNYVGLVDDKNHLQTTDGKVRVVDTKGKKIVKYEASDYLQQPAEYVEPWSYPKFPYLEAKWRSTLSWAATKNHAPICMAIKRAAQGPIKRNEQITDGALNMIEMAFRAYDPCFSGATHNLLGHVPLEVVAREKDGSIVARRQREPLGRPHEQ
jgi:coenzyme F420-reducing hydrogenase alpha subunit